MRLSRHAVASVLICTVLACHRQGFGWPDLASKTGCTPELLARTPSYDSSRVLSLVGSYRLIEIDTARGWIELESSFPHPGEWPRLRLWVVDSVHARWRRSIITQSLVRVNRPVAGMVAGNEEKGFTADNPQTEVTSRDLNELTIRFTPGIVLDGPIEFLPIARLGSWGFGGYFEDGAIVVPVGRDGKPLGQRAGYYCAFRQ